jgi:hypothetical protein
VSPELGGGTAEQLRGTLAIGAAIAAGSVALDEVNASGFGGEPEGIGGGETGCFGFELGLLVAVSDLRCFDLGNLERQQVHFAGELPGVAAELAQPGIELEEPLTGGVRLCRIDAGEVVERLALSGHAEEGLVGMLPMEVDESGAKAGQCGCGGHAPVDVGTRSTLGWDLANDDGLLASIAPDIDRPHESAFDYGFGDEGLAGAGLPGERCHTRAEHEIESLDDPEIPHPYLDEHRPQRSEREKRDRSTA